MKRGVARGWGAVHRQPECLCWLQALWPPKLPSKVSTNLGASQLSSGLGILFLLKE